MAVSSRHNPPVWSGGSSCFHHIQTSEFSSSSQFRSLRVVSWRGALRYCLSRSRSHSHRAKTSSHRRITQSHLTLTDVAAT